ncbi:MAG: bifunctional metallophosphatase/5'-nucleotidase [Spirosomataceae bacterium]
MKKIAFLFLAFQIVLFSCRTAKVGSKDQTEIVFLHLNDVYEISPLEGGKKGGMARVATVRKELIQKNPNVVTVLSGDFLSPSVLGTLKYEGKTIRGRQMVDAMNAVGIDWVCLGNHEFDISEADLQERINESKFNWINTNALQNKGGNLEPFGKIVNGVKQPFAKTKILEFKDAKGNTIKVGLFGILLPSNRKDFVFYDDFFESAKKAYNELKPQCDFVVALTHIDKADDAKLATMLPDLKLMMGGHDHDNMIQKIGGVTLAKADANAKTVYIHRLIYNAKTKSVEVKSELKEINDKIADEPTTAAVVKKWEDIADENYRKMGLDKNNVIYVAKEPLDGRESSIRNFQTNLGNLIAKSTAAAVPSGVDCAIFNGGSVRIDDQLEGDVTELDILRVLPFGGKVLGVKMKGRLLERTLETGLKNKGSGGYLQWDNVRYDEASKQWFINGKLLDVNQEYNVSTSDFLMSGKEKGLDFLTTKNPDVVSVYEPKDSDVGGDIRRAVIVYLKK